MGLPAHCSPALPHVCARTTRASVCTRALIPSPVYASRQAAEEQIHGVGLEPVCGKKTCEL